MTDTKIAYFFIFTLFLLFCRYTALTQQHSITVIDIQTREPVDDAKISFHKNVGFYADKNGEFYLESEEDSLLITISHLGYYETKVVSYTNQPVLVELIPEPKHLGEINVSASRFNHKLKTSDASIGLLLSEQFENSKNEQLANIVNQIPGMYMHNGTYNTNRIVIRGIGSRNPYGSNRVKAYLNDIPLTGGDGITIIEDLSLQEIGRIEILKGPASAIYGSGLAGTIKMYTRYAQKKGISARSTIQTGSFGLKKYGINLSYKGKTSVLSTSAGRQESNGYRQNSSYYNNHAMINGIYFLPKTEIRYLFNFIKLKAFIPSSLSKDTFENNPKSAAQNWKAINGFEKYNKLTGGITVVNKLTDKGKLNTSLFYAYNDLYESRPFNILSTSNHTAGIRSNYQSTLCNAELNMGFELLHENIHWTTYITNQGEKGDAINDMEEIRRYLNIYAQDKLSITKKLSLTTSLNLNLLQYDLKASDSEDYGPVSYTYKPILSPRVGVNYSLSNITNIYGSVGHGFSAPSFEETLLPDGRRNNNLKQETGWSVETGAKGNAAGERLYYELSYYSIFVKNMLVTKRISEEEFMGVNAGKTYHTGLESLINIHLIQNESIQLDLNNAFNYSLNLFREFEDDGLDYSNNHLPGIPDMSYSGNLSFHYKKIFKAGISFKHFGKQYLNDSNDGFYKGYNTWNADIAFQKKLNRDLAIKLSLGVENILDSDYASMILINAPSFGGSIPRTYYPGLPRNYFLRLVFNY